MLRATQRPLGVSGRSLTQSRSDSGVYTGLPSASLVSRDFARFRALHVQQLDHVFAFRSPLKRPKIGTGCANVIPSPATIFRLPSGQGFAPTPRISAYVLNVVSGSLPLPRPLAHYVRSLGLGSERDHLSHVVGDPGVVLWG